jgi:hypothetical protein
MKSSPLYLNSKNISISTAVAAASAACAIAVFSQVQLLPSSFVDVYKPSL